MTDHFIWHFSGEHLLKGLVEDLSDPELQQGRVVWIVPLDARS
jgi:hypothetical protein